jgi:hypothetical protein
MRQTMTVVFAALLFWLCVSSCGASGYILDSATLGETGLPGSSEGYTVASFQFVGARFHVDQLTTVDHIDGVLGNFNFGDTNKIFGAIVAIGSGGDGFPASSPGAFAPLAETTFGLPYLTSDISVPLSETLPAGDYALVFGSGLFGATATASLSTLNTDTAQASFFFGQIESIGSPGFWQDDSAAENMRFTVNGAAVPEPSGVMLAALGFGGLIVWGWRRRNR